jgi:uncharacterized protein (UPF0261 family)
MPELPIAISTGPHTRPCAEEVVRLLKNMNRLTRLYEADALAMEADILAGRIASVLDITLTELITGTAGPDRLTAAALQAVPQVIVPGGLGELSPNQWDRLGQEIANKASAARGPTTIVIPICDVSDVFAESLRNWIIPSVRIRELELHVNDPAFAAAVVAALEVKS